MHLNFLTFYEISRIYLKKKNRFINYELTAHLIQILCDKFVYWNLSILTKAFVSLIVKLLIFLQATTTSQCRYDWHQTGTMVTVTIYAKMMLPEESFIETNQVICNIFIKYDGGKKSFSKKIVLGGVSDY